MAELKTYRFRPPVNGWSTQRSPLDTNSGYAPVLRNVLVHRDGTLPMRGEIIGRSSTGFTTSRFPVCGSSVGGRLFVSVVGAASGVMPWHAAVSGSLSLEDATTYTDVHVVTLGGASDGGASFGTLADFGAAVCPGVQQVGDYWYGLDLTSTSAAIDQVGAPQSATRRPGKLRRVYRDGTELVYANAPVAGVSCCYYLNRLFILGSTVVGGTSVHPNRVVWSDPFTAALNDTANDWKDDISGLDNQIILDGATSNAGQAIIEVNGQLLIFRRDTVDVLAGRTPASFQVRQLSTDGCLDPRTIARVGEAVVWLSRRGLMWTDGASFRVLSDNVESAVATASAQAFSTATPGGLASVTSMHNDYVGLTIAAQNLAVGADDSTRDPVYFSGLCHVPSGRWVELTISTTVMKTGAPVVWIGSVGEHAYCVARNNSTSIYNLYGGPITENDEFSRYGYEGYPPDRRWYDRNVSDTNRAAIPATWQSYAQPLGGLTRRAQLRYWIFNSMAMTETASTGNSWLARLRETRSDNLTALVLGQLQATKTGTAFPPNYRDPRVRRVAAELFSETDAVYLDVTWNGGTTVEQRGPTEVYDAVVEYQTTHVRVSV